MRPVRFTPGTVKYCDVVNMQYDYYDPDGNCLFGFATERVDNSGTFGEAVYRLAQQCTRRNTIDQLLMTTRQNWSGYSEYTITNTWSEIVLTAPRLGWEQEWPSLGAFLGALMEANPEAEGLHR